jgi:hypothetical protein
MFRECDMAIWRCGRAGTVTICPCTVLSGFISAGLFSVTQVENEVKQGLHFVDVFEIQEAVTDKDGPKRGIFGSFSETVLVCQKPVYMQLELF